MKTGITVVVAVASGLVVGQAQADKLYKCTDPATGRVTVSQMRCAGDAAEVHVDVTRPTAQQVEATKAREAYYVERMTKQIELDRSTRAIARQQEQIEALEAQRNAELASIARQRSRASNNLAGSAFLQSLAERELAVSTRYQGQIDAARAQMEQHF